MNVPRLDISVFLIDGDYAARIFHWQRAENQRVQQRENPRIDADAERRRHEDRTRQSGRLEQSANTVADVGSHCVQKTEMHIRVLETLGLAAQIPRYGAQGLFPKPPRGMSSSRVFLQKVSHNGFIASPA